MRERPNPNAVDRVKGKESRSISKIALLFPGQGSQYVGMGQDVFKSSPAARRVFEEASDTLGFDVSQVCFEGPEEHLRQTENAQPALLTVSVATLEALRDLNGGSIPKARFVAGHSVGEYAASVAARAISFSDALKLVRTRGLLMQQAGRIREGSMVAILGLDVSDVEQLCQQVGAEIANDNCPGQQVISGSKKSLINAIDLSKALGAKRAIPLDVSGAFHSRLMDSAIPEMTEAINRTHFNNPVIPIISNVTGEPIYSGEALSQELIDQISLPVRWTRSVEFMSQRGVDTFVEVGSGKVLAGLVKRIVKDVANIFNADSSESVKSVVDALRPRKAKLSTGSFGLRGNS